MFNLFKKRPLVDYLLLEYISRGLHHTLKGYVNQAGIEDNNEIYHGLEVTELTKRMYNLMQEGMFILGRNSQCNSLDRVSFTQRELKKFFQLHQEEQRDDLKSYIFIRLSLKGGETWAQGVRANWNKYYVGAHSFERSILDSCNLKLLTKVFKIYQEYQRVPPSCHVEFKTVKPWYPFFVYWKQFKQGYSYKLSYQPPKNDREIEAKEDFYDYESEASWKLRKLSLWRDRWMLDEEGGFYLMNPREWYEREMEIRRKYAGINPCEKNELT